jgi:hypothetical protein
VVLLIASPELFVLGLVPIPDNGMKRKRKYSQKNKLSIWHEKNLRNTDTKNQYNPECYKKLALWVMVV